MTQPANTRAALEMISIEKKLAKMRLERMAFAAKTSPDLNTLRAALMKLDYAFQNAQREFGFSDIEEFLQTDEIPCFCAPVELPNLSVPIWAFDGERLLVGPSWESHELYFTNHEGERI